MEFLKSLRLTRILIISLLACYGNLINATNYNNQHIMPTIPPSKCSISYKAFLSANPAVQIHVATIQPKNEGNNKERTLYVLKQPPKFNDRQQDAVSKENALKSIINALKGKTSATHNYIIPPVHLPPPVFAPRPTNHFIPNQNGNNHVVYNIENHGVHHHYYGSVAANGNTQPKFVPLKYANTNQTTQFINDVPAQK